MIRSYGENFVMNKLAVLATTAFVGTCVLVAPALATDWWFLQRASENSSYDTNSFTTCVQNKFSPAYDYEIERDKGSFPEIKDDGDKVIVHWNVRDPRTGLETGDESRITYFRTSASCEKEAAARKAEADADKKLSKYC
jgi:hypothetical protein